MNRKRKLTNRCAPEREKRRESTLVYVFFPHIYLLVQDGRTGQNFYKCPYVQSFVIYFINEKQLVLFFYLTLRNLNSSSLIATACFAFSS
jgi:hypothetical protein